ncbi:hypothetical protein [Rosistilla oblonga]|uniref:Uncharacterized protein n=1 Tax=Rosistilla oblonga TaxID=2527990 RepID=A0A518ITU4_9BACT|nr:hypothetical protein [Rosistilla oblonga]QDV56509.1 hypothetical protein Mal33_25000 [Rosistilla oblonga]
MIVVLATGISGTEFAFDPGTLLDVSDTAAARLIAGGLANPVVDAEIDPAKVKTLPRSRRQSVAPSVVDASNTVDNIDTNSMDVDVDLADLVDYGLDPKVHARLIAGLAELDATTRPSTGRELIQWSADNGGMGELAEVGAASVRDIHVVFRSLGLIQ